MDPNATPIDLKVFEGPLNVIYMYATILFDWVKEPYNLISTFLSKSCSSFISNIIQYGESISTFHNGFKWEYVSNFISKSMDTMNTFIGSLTHWSREQFAMFSTFLSNCFESFMSNTIMYRENISTYYKWHIQEYAFIKYLAIIAGLIIIVYIIISIISKYYSNKIVPLMVSLNNYLLGFITGGSFFLLFYAGYSGTIGLTFDFITNEIFFRQLIGCCFSLLAIAFLTICFARIIISSLLSTGFYSYVAYLIYGALLVCSIYISYVLLAFFIFISILFIFYNDNSISILKEIHKCLGILMDYLFMTGIVVSIGAIIATIISYISYNVSLTFDIKTLFGNYTDMNLSYYSNMLGFLATIFIAICVLTYLANLFKAYYCNVIHKHETKVSGPSVFSSDNNIVGFSFISSGLLTSIILIMSSLYYSSGSSSYVKLTLLMFFAGLYLMVSINQDTLLPFHCISYFPNTDINLVTAKEYLKICGISNINSRLIITKIVLFVLTGLFYLFFPIIYSAIFVITPSIGVVALFSYIFFTILEAIISSQMALLYIKADKIIYGKVFDNCNNNLASIKD